MKVNTVCIALEEYNALMKDNQRMHRSIQEQKEVITKASNLLMEEMIEYSKRVYSDGSSANVKYTSIEADKLAKALGFDFDVLVEQVKSMRLDETIEDVTHGYAE